MTLHADEANTMVLDSLEAIAIGGVTQWIRIRDQEPAGAAAGPARPGPADDQEVSSFERTLNPEAHVTVVYWDQRGCGLSLRSPKSPTRLDLALLVSDTVELLELLYVQFGGPSFVTGFSIGATVGAMVATRAQSSSRP
jgi:pimeloyl-ACP methyl ester carboxylesterase